MSSRFVLPIHILLCLSSSAIPFSSSLQSFPASGSFQMSKLFASDSQSIGFSFRNDPSNEYSGLISFRMNWLDLLQSKGLSRVFSNNTVKKHQFFGTQPFLNGSTLTSIHDCWKDHSYDWTDLCWQSNVSAF